MIAHTRDRFRDFGPYVASIDRRGRVAFQATLRDGQTGVFIGTGTGVCKEVVQPNREISDRYYSHPDINARGHVSAYTEQRSGPQRVVRIGGGRAWTIADTTGAFERIGPLGPTMNEAGTVAFRAHTPAGPGIFVGDGGPTVTIADAESFREFHGLPVITQHEVVVFRADTHDDLEGIYLWRGDGTPLETIVDSSRGFSEIGFFPSIDDGGSVTFQATRSGNWRFDSSSTTACR